ncbi:MAG: VTT domain-containing protein [Actinomycetia bacterium]|nr:VTT domain-containing protein [Actinomycetes bacterium]MCP4961376.1 VTT domain-containing protein [Actinomycetes bacterium]
MSDAPGPILNADERYRLWRIAALPVALAVAALVGQLFFATLATKLPLLLIAMAPSDAFLILTVGSVPTWAFFIIGFARLVGPDPFLYRLGYEFGPASRRYIDAELGSPNKITGAIDVLQRWFPRIGLVLLVILPNYPVCLLAGMTRIRFWVFAVLNAAGTAGRLWIIWHLGRMVEGPIGSILDFLGRYQLPAMIAMAVLIGFQVGRAERDPDGQGLPKGSPEAGLDS